MEEEEEEEEEDEAEEVKGGGPVLPLHKLSVKELRALAIVEGSTLDIQKCKKQEVLQELRRLRQLRVMVVV